MKDVTRIEILGPEHSKKTTLLILIADYLESIGVNVVRQQADPEFSSKMKKTGDELEAKVHGMQVMITEMNTK